MPRPDGGRHVGVDLVGQPRRRPDAGGRPGPGREPQAPVLRLRDVQPHGAVLRRPVRPAYVGGLFWDGRVPDLSTQANQPFINPNEMANTPTNGVYPPTSGAIPPSSSRRSGRSMPRTSRRPSAPTSSPSSYTDDQMLYTVICQLCTDYETSSELNQFSSKYDASPFGVPPGTLYTSPHPRSGGGNSTSASERRTPIAPSATPPRISRP